ncbi:hypothetical protein SAMN05444972_101172 [Marininema halotolerans]|uniref:Uncharacterized protein n=1 Tax=Marininema halotolerans TaxID=1155944 RepID=A0A1I6NVU1_9BACL|nr:hypothetical protein SAMN05444972_101172 [Marininema halotolerans]
MRMRFALSMLLLTTIFSEYCLFYQEKLMKLASILTLLPSSYALVLSFFPRRR